MVLQEVFTDWFAFLPLYVKHKSKVPINVNCPMKLSLEIQYMLMEYIFISM